MVWTLGFSSTFGIRASSLIHRDVSTSLDMTFCQLHGEINRGDHAVRAGDSFAGNFKRGAVIGTGARKRKPKRHVHTLVKGVEFQRNQSLVVIHAEYRVEFAFNRTMKNCVGGLWPDESGMWLVRSEK